MAARSESSRFGACGGVWIGVTDFPVGRVHRPIHRQPAFGDRLSRLFNIESWRVELDPLKACRFACLELLSQRAGHVHHPNLERLPKAPFEAIPLGAGEIGWVRFFSPCEKGTASGEKRRRGQRGG